MIGLINDTVGACDAVLRSRFKMQQPNYQRRYTMHMEMKLQSLLSGVPHLRIYGDENLHVSSLCTDSRTVMPGALFFALPGRNVNGVEFLDQAVERGAVGVVSEASANKAHPNITHIQVDDVREALSIAASSYYGHTDKKMQLVGVTGTNGKTSVTCLAQHLIASVGTKVGRIGTIGYDLGSRLLPANKTTPESLEIHSMLAAMYEEDCRKCCMEVSSHAIDQKRIQGISIDIGVFLNLTQDHLDYHESMDQYFDTKARFLTGRSGNVPSIAIVNSDDPYGLKLIDMLPGDTTVYRYGLSEGADVRGTIVAMDDNGTLVNIEGPFDPIQVRTPMPGKYNVSNLLAAITIAYASGVDMHTVGDKLKTFSGVPGRMERVDEGQKYKVFVDYAHTDDALRNALSMLKEICKGRLLVVFGCGGDRDRSKRPKMVNAVQSFADYAWATSDNPRSEAIEQIFEDMRSGVVSEENITFEEDRSAAIEAAVSYAQDGDIILIAGKGHETFQQMAHTLVPFDDRQVARTCIHEEKKKSLKS